MRILKIEMVVGGGFGPPKAWPVDLQSTAFDRSATPPEGKLHVERVEGIEPSQLAWKANVLPLNYTRRQFSVRFITIHLLPEKSSPERKKSGKKPGFDDKTLFLLKSQKPCICFCDGRMHGKNRHDICGKKSVRTGRGERSDPVSGERKQARGKTSARRM